MIMPNLAGLNYQEAQDALEEVGIYVAYPVYAFLSAPQITVQWESSGPEGGLVLGQSPLSGAEVAKAAPITLTLSTFPVAAVISPGY